MTEVDLFAKPKIRRGGRRAGAILILIGIGIPVIFSLFQEDGSLIFFSRLTRGERTLSPVEVNEIKSIVQERKSRLKGIEKAVESVKEKYRSQMGEDYYKDVWVVSTRSGFVIPFKYAMVLGFLLILIGVGKLIVG